MAILDMTVAEGNMLDAPAGEAEVEEVKKVELEERDDDNGEMSGMKIGSVKDGIYGCWI